MYMFVCNMYTYVGMCMCTFAAVGLGVCYHANNIQDTAEITQQGR
jgi:hypothetical protein